MSKSMFPNLLSPIEIKKGFVLKNRMIKAPQSTWYWEADGSAGKRVTDFYETIAAGGASMIVISAVLWTYPQPGGIYAGMYDDKYIEPMRKMVKRLQSYGCKVMCQLHHTGPSASANFDGTEPIGPSTLDSDELPSPYPTLVKTRGLTIEEIEEQKELYLTAAERAKKAGFDGIEIHCAHGYFFESFTSKVWNKRTDKYGAQNWENRTRLIVEVTKGLKERLGADYPLGVRMNAQEWGAKDAMSVDDCVQLAKVFEREGVNYISVSGYGYGAAPFRYLPDYFPYPEPDEYMKPYMNDYYGDGLWVPGAIAIKKAVKVPTIIAGRMDEKKGEALIAAGKTDLIALGRTLWADPEFPNKVAEGRLGDIVRCNRCATCEDPMVGPRRCRVNPSIGREAELAITPAEKSKKVMIIGGGPSGMEAARVLKLRGHKVDLYERKGALGGYLPLASMIKGSKIENVLPVVDYLKRQVEKLGINVHLKSEVNLQLINREKPDVIILATGGKYELPDVEGINNSIVQSVDQLSSKVKLPLALFGPQRLEQLTQLFLPIGKNVVILGGQIEACQGAAFMRKRGRNVTIIEQSDTIAKGIPPRYRDRLLPWFEKRGVQILKNVKVQKITDKGVLMKNADGYEYLKEADTVLVLMPQNPNNDLFDQLKGSKYTVRKIGAAGGAVEGSLIVDALRTARETACEI